MNVAAAPPDRPAVFPAHARAATAVWIAAAGLLLLGGCLSASLAAVALTPAEALTANPTVAAMPEGDRAQLLKLQRSAGPAALGAALLLVVPAGTLLVFGFAVRRGQARAAVVTRVLCVVAAVLLSVWALASLTAGVAGLPVALVLGGLIALLWRASVLLRVDRYRVDADVDNVDVSTARAGGLGPRPGVDDDPWDALL